MFAAIACLAGGCHNKKEIEMARRSVYDADFAVVYSAALEATRELYANLDDFPGSGMIKTAWHQVSFANTQDDLSSNRTLSSNSAQLPATSGGMPTRLAYKRQFIRFDVSVTGGRPWRVKVVGHAAEWDPGNAMPTELRGMARPPWLDGRTEALQVAIYRRMKSHAKPMKEKIVAPRPEDELPKTDPSTFAKVPAKAASQLALIKDALGRRDYNGLRSIVADDVVWSLGGAPGADTALAMWQADPETLDAMATAINTGCAGEDKRVACPAGPAKRGSWQLVLELRGDTWKIASFLKAE
ncbi:MAG: hypothetical protein AB7P03_03785 [Kofleriaceae bacterium]